MTVIAGKDRSKDRNKDSRRARNTVRIIAGKWRSRRLEFPDAEGLRPTADRVRETLFNWLQNYILEEDCLDLFAGSGACGFEALSRGARHVTFLETSRPAIAALQSNLRLLEAHNVTVLGQDALGWLQAAGATRDRQYGIVFVDPPFGAGLQGKACAALEASGLLKDQALIYVESGAGFPASALPPQWEVLKSSRAGAVHFYLYRRRPTLEQEA